MLKGVLKILAFPIRDWRLYRAYRFALFLNLLSIVFGALTFFYLGELLNSENLARVSGFTSGYFGYVLIGISLSTFLASTLNGMASGISREFSLGTIEAVFACPIDEKLVVFASGLWQLVLSFATAALYLTIGYLLGAFPFTPVRLLSAAAVFFLSALIFLSLGAVASAFILYFKKGNPITWIFSSISIFLGGVYFPIELLPKAIQFLSFFVPLRFCTHALRIALLPDSSGDRFWISLLILAGFALLLLPLGWWSLSTSIRKCKKKGVLGHQ